MDAKVELLPHSDLRPTPAGRNEEVTEERPPRQPVTKPLAGLTVLVLEGEYRLTRAVLFCLSQWPGMRVHLLTRSTHNYYRFSGYLRACHVCAPGQSDAAFVAFTQQVAQTTQAQVLMPVDVAGMRFVIAHRPAFEATMRVLPLPSAAYYEIASDKGLLAAFMQEHEIPAPDTLLDIRHGLAEKLVGFRFPVLLKPIHGCGGQGIVQYNEPATLLQAVADLPKADQYIIQNCLEGYDIDCNVLYQNGRLVAHSIQKALVAAAGKYAPAEAIEFVRSSAVLAVVDRLMRALNWNGVAHLDLRYDARDQQIKVIEINTRFWQTVVGSAVAAKVNFPALACLAATGRTVLPGPTALGRYIPFASFLKLRFGHRTYASPEISFAWRDTSLRFFLGNVADQLYHLLLTDEN